jgi:putative spermidine/putrescine transport system substrate-binding protein
MSNELKGNPIDRRRVMTGLAAAGGLAAGLHGLRRPSALAAASEVVVCNYGGQQVPTMKAAFTDDFTKQTGLPVVYDTSGPNAGKLRAMMENGKAIWDVCDSSPSIGIDLGGKGMLEEIDYSIVDSNKVTPGLAQKYAVGSYLFSTVITYDKRVYKDRVPQTWADVWNLKEFPGKRVLSRISQSILEAALMADGVPPDQLYPLDVKHALEKIKEIKSQTLFWRTASEGMQFMRSGECSIGAMWNTRAATLKKETDGAIDHQWNQGVLQSAAWVVPKGNPAGRTNAMKLIAFMQDPDRQIAFLETNLAGPMNPAANAKLPPADIDLSPGAPANRQKQILMNYDWLAKNYETVEPQYIEAIS